MLTSVPACLCHFALLQVPPTTALIASLKPCLRLPSPHAAVSGRSDATAAAQKSKAFARMAARDGTAASEFGGK
jgi:hypothetical protein